MILSSNVTWESILGAAVRGASLEPSGATRRVRSAGRDRTAFTARRARVGAALTVAVSFFSLGSACGGRGVDDGAIALAVASAPESLDPRRATSAVAQRLSQLVAAPLFVVSEDLVPRAVLAEGIFAESATAYVVALRAGARFADGAPVTAADVAFTFTSIFDPAVRSPHASRFEMLDRVEVIDDRRARFVLKRPFAPFPVEVCAIGVLSARACKDVVGACSAGAGPFRVVAAAPGLERIDLAPNAHFVDGPPAINLVVRVVRDGNTRLLELLHGKTDVVVGDVSPMDVRAVEGAAHLVVHRAPGTGFTYLAMNLRDGPLQDARVRRAIASAIDIDRIIATKFLGAARRATGLLPPEHWANVEDVPPIPFDPALARRLLDDAGLPQREGGRFRVSLATTTDRLRKSIALVVAQQLRDVGVAVDVDVREWAALYEDIQRGAFDLFSAKWVPVVEPDLMRWVFHSDAIPGPGKAGGNRGAYRNPDVDAALDDGRRETDRDARARSYAIAQRAVAADLPLVPLWFEDEVAIVSARVQGFAPSRTGSLLPLARARIAP